MFGGLLGSAFTHLNLVIARRRKRFMASIKVRLMGIQIENFHPDPDPG